MNQEIIANTMLREWSSAFRRSGIRGMVKVDLKFKQIIACQWKDTYSIVGLSEAGYVYVYEKAKVGWVKYAMHEVERHGVNNN